MEHLDGLIRLINDNISSGKTALPVFNKIAFKVQQEISKEDPDDGLIKRLISNDPSLTSQVLKTANSPYYKGVHEVETVAEAVTRLGMQEVANLVLLISQKSNFKSTDPYVQEVMNQLWRHSVGCAIGSQWLAARKGFFDLAGQAFTAGLLHDVGKLFILTVIDSLIFQGNHELKVPLPTLKHIMSDIHVRHGYTLMTIWGLPEIYCEVVRDHHTEKIDSQNILLILVQLVNQVCSRIGLGLSMPTDDDPTQSAGAKILSVTDIDLAELEIKLEDSKILY